MRALLVVAALTAVVLAGCTDEPPSGEVSGNAATVPFDGSLAIQTQEFVNPSPTSGQQGGDDCQQNQVEQLAQFHCTFPYTKAELHLMSFPDPQAGSFSARWAGGGAYEDFPAFSMNGTDPNVMYVSMFDNEAACDGQTDTAECDYTQKFQNVEIFLDDLLLGTVSMSGTFELNSSLSGTSFTLAYNGKDATVTLNADSGLAYDLVLYTQDEAGALTAVETYSVSAGENEVTAANNFDTYAQAHIHVAGTKVNLATAGFQ